MGEKREAFEGKLLRGLFFFSSRRRHTRFDCDWSSDVCSSDLIWTRMAFASFGIIPPVLSVVISVFMLGLSFGAWLGGRLIKRLTKKTQFSAIVFYMLAELVIGVGAFAVPLFFGASEEIMLSAGQMDSFRYLFLSALLLAFSILPWCVCMGATFPFMMAYV